MKFGSLSITTTDGRTRDYPIDLPSLVVGRADSNSIVIDDLSVSRRHARLVIDSGRLMVEDLASATGTFVGDVRIPPNTLSLVGDEQTIRFGDVEARYNPEGSESPVPLAVASALPLAPLAPATVAPPPPADAPAVVRAALSVPTSPLNPGGDPGQLQLQVLNRGNIVDEFFVAIEGVPAEWVTIGLDRLILRPGEQGEVPIGIAPPRRSESHAGEYDVIARVTSRETGIEAVANGALHVLAFEGTALSLQPVRSKRDFKLVAENEGNALATYALSGTDDEEAFDYKFSKPSLQLPPGEKTSLPFRVSSNKHALFGQKKTLPFKVIATPTADRGTEAQIEGQLTVAPPLEPLKRPAMFTALLLVVALGALVFFFLPQDNNAKATTTEDAYAGVHLCDKDGKPTDAVQKEIAAAASTTTASGGQIPKGATASGGPYFAQNDPRWANDQYAKAGDPDFGPDWCGTTIAQCGCAMTSVTTVMALYNILTMPDGSDLTPQSVNDWFNGNARKTSRGWVSQGYIYGDVIWTAANQLSGEIAKIRPGSPTIKFSRTGTGSDEEIRTELKAGRPIVLEVPGHWISAVGIDDNNKILINDPFYRDRKTLDAYAGKVKSSVLFEASDDLSAVVITVPADERVRVTNIKTGEQVGDLNTGSQQDAKDAAKLEIPGASYSARDGWRDPTCIASPPPPGSGTNQIVLPGSKDDYKIEVLDTSGGTASVAIHTYDKSGSPSVTTLDNAGSVVASVGYDPTQGQPQVQQLDETPQADSSSDRVAGKTPTPVKPSPTATTPATVTPVATPTQGPVTTILSLSVSPGAKVVNIGSNLGFGLGDTIRFSPGASNEEDNTIVGFGSFILAAPLKYAHSAGEPIVRIAGVPGGGAPPPPTSTDIPPPDGVKLDCSPIYSAAPRQATLICSATVTGTFTTTRWTVDGRVQSQFSGQTIIVTVFTQDATTALTVAACNVTVCVSAATTQAIRFPVSPNEPQSQATPTPPPPVPTPPPAPPATGLAASCSLTITTNPDATIKCQPLTNIKSFSSITWDIPALTPSSSRPSPDGSPLLRVIKPADLVPDKSGNADVLVTATLCSASTSGPSNNCTVSAPATISIPYATTTLSVLPVTDPGGPKLSLGSTASLFAVIKGPVVPSGGTVQFVTVDTNGDTHPIGLEQKVQLYPGFAFAQLNVPTGTIPFDAQGHYDVQAIYSGSNNIFGGPSATVGLDLGPRIVDTCNALDDNANGQVDENCVLPNPVSGQIDIGSGTILRGVTLNGGNTNDIVVAPNAALSVDSGVSRKSSPAGTDLYCANCSRQVYMGIGPNAAVVPPVGPVGPVCAVNQSLDQYDDTVTPLQFTASGLHAPGTPGLYYIRATGSVQSSCGQPDVGGPDTSVARVIVKGPTVTGAPVFTDANNAPVTAVKLGVPLTITASVRYPADPNVQVSGFVAFCDGASGSTPSQPCNGGRLLGTAAVTNGPVVSGIQTRQAVLPFDSTCFYDGLCPGLTPATATAVASHNITAHFLDNGPFFANQFFYSSDATGNGSQAGAAAALDVNAAAVTTQVLVGQSPVKLGDTVSLTASVKSGGFGPFSGTVQFFDGTTAVGGPQTVSGAEIGVAVLNLDTSILYPGSGTAPVGSHTFTAIFSGGGNYAATPSPAGGSAVSGSLTVTRAIPTISLSLPTSTTSLGSTMVLTATLSPASGGSPAFGSFTGTVHFFADGNELTGSPVCVTTTPTSAAITLDTASFYSSGTVGANHSITAQYTSAVGSCGGSAGNYTDSNTTSQPLTITPADTSISITSSAPSPNPKLGTSFTIAATVSAANFGNFGGTVDFVEGSNILCTKSINTDGTVSCLLDTSNFSPGPPTPVGAHQITAHYSGAGNYKSSDSTAQSVTIDKATTTVTLTAPASAQLGTTITLTGQAKVGATVGQPFGAWPGTMTFYDGATPLGTATAVDSNGLASISYDTSGLATVGNHSITAVFSGGGNYDTSTSTAATLNATAADVTLILSANPLTVVGAQSVTFTVSASGAVGVPAGTVTLNNGSGATVCSGPLASGT